MGKIGLVTAFVLVLLAALCAGFAGVASASLVMIDLGTLGGNVSEALAISPSGQVVGLSLNAYGEQHAFLWTQAEGMVDLGTLGNASYAIAVNDSGQVAGTSWVAPGVYHAFSWTLASGMVDLGTLGGCSWSVTNAANASGQVVGYSYAADTLPYAFSWTQAGGMVDLGLGAATAVNDSGQVVGQDGATHAVLWTEGGQMVKLGGGFALAVNAGGQVVGLNGVALGATQAFSWTQAGGRIDLGTLGGGNAWASAVNDSGQVVGTSETTGGLTHAFSWTQAGGMVDLGTLGGGFSTLGPWDWQFHRAVNASGQVVGWSETSDGRTHAFSWTRTGGMVDLGTLGGTESRAHAVNDRGDIVGDSATADGFHHAVLWKVRPLIVTPINLNSGRVLKGSSSDETIRVKNAGTAPLTITTIGSPAPPFSITGGGTCMAPHVLPSGESCTIVVRFSPNAQAPASSTFNITSTDPEEPSVTVHLSGRGVQLLVTPDEGTIGDEVTITGAGFGASKGKVLIGGVAPKITKWTDIEIKVTLSKVPIPNVARDVVVQPKGPKGTPSITEAGVFTARGPKISGVDQLIVVPGSTRIIFGNIFLTKKGKVTLERDGVVKSCKVENWQTNEIHWRVPKIDRGWATLRVSTKAGSSTLAVFVGPSYPFIVLGREGDSIARAEPGRAKERIPLN